MQRRRQGTAGLQLADRVFLIATVVGGEDNLARGCCTGRGVGNVEEVRLVMKQLLLSLGDLDVFPQSYDTVGS